jgi:hypothetical protein
VGESYKYTDAHVRADRELYDTLAVEYLQHYAGDFDLLLSYRRRIELGVELTVPMIRATLNCMRFDAQVVGLPTPSARVFDARDVAPVIDIKTRSVKKTTHGGLAGGLAGALGEVCVAAKPRYVKLRTHWNKTYVVSSWSTASRVHRVAPSSHFEWDTRDQTFHCRLWWACKPSWNWSRTPFELLSAGEASALVSSLPSWQYCRKCVEVMCDV